MKSKLTKFEKECLRKAIDFATKACKTGVNYPVGAVLSIDDKIIDAAGSNMLKSKSRVMHAENILIIRNGGKLFKAFEAGKKSTLFTTLEPCIQCLGSCVTNNISRIIYIQKDPNGGACNMKHDKIGLHYREVWPEIIHAPISEKPKKLMIAFFNSEIKKGNIEWPSKMLKLLANG
ncbi:MAG: deaminase [Parcubacteria group bacterium]|jgi:tRNA(adenine34) deaminase